MRRLAWLAALLLPLPAAAQGYGPQVGPTPGQGYNATLAPAAGNMAFASVTVSTASTLVLGPPLLLPRSKLYLVNPSGRTAGTTTTDVWCAYGVPAVLGQGFLLAGYGDRVTEDMPAAIDQRALSCIASAATAITVGAVQQ